MEQQLYPIIYQFKFSDQPVKVFEILIDSKTISLIPPAQRMPPDWTKLLYYQCDCCPLDPCQHPYCSIAVNLARVIEAFKYIDSSAACFLRCITPERSYGKKTFVQDGLFSIFGILMATSNCPVMNFFKPMARFHLPFATSRETIFRSASIYLLRQYFEYKKGKTPDIGLKGLYKYYAKVQVLNRGILSRTANVSRKDADKNAIVILDVLAQLLNMEIEEDLTSIQYLFESN